MSKPLSPDSFHPEYDPVNPKYRGKISHDLAKTLRSYGEAGNVVSDEVEAIIDEMNSTRIESILGDHESEFEDRGEASE